MKSAHILAPAKVNLGLAILGRRPDGYHEIDTIMAMIDLFDDITVTEGVVSGISISGMDDVPIESNLMTKAIQLWCDEAYVAPNWHIDIVKRIPSPAGIGGGSSDAAAVLRALNALHHDALPEAVLLQIASELGADCPFFLDGPCARATGIGTDLSPLPAPEGSLVIAVPMVNVPGKTKSLYGALTPGDYGSAVDIDEIARSISAGTGLPDSLANSFLRPALSTFPGLDRVAEAMVDTCEGYALSGAGPALYALAPSATLAQTWTATLHSELEDDLQVFTANFLSESPSPSCSR